MNILKNIKPKVLLNFLIVAIICNAATSLYFETTYNDVNTFVVYGYT